MFGIRFVFGLTCERLFLMFSLFLRGVRED